MHKPFIISKAAAGSGKTFMLVREFLKLSLAGSDEGVERRFRSILAITFTNKAANEMKERIVGHLDALAALDPEAEPGGMAAALIEAMADDDPSRPAPTPADLRRKARRLRSALLHHYSDLSVMTIDSFMHRIVRTFAHDLGQPEGFEVQVEDDDLVALTVDQLMAQVGADEQLTRLLTAFADARMEEDKSYNIEALVGDMARQLFREDTDLWLEQLKGLGPADFERLYALCRDANRDFVQQLLGIGREAARTLADAGVDEADTPYGRSGWTAFFRKLADGQAAAPGQRARQAFASGKLLKDAKSHALDAHAPCLKQLFDSATALLDGGLPLYNTRQALMRNLYTMAVLGTLRDLMHRCSHDNEVLHISEFNKLINNIIVNEPAPFIYERLGSRYSHLLIDEFQDTSVLQWHNLVPLVDEGVGRGEQSLVVGDGKQAIYRFRQGDVRQFIDLPQVRGLRLHGKALALDENHRFSPLDANYRSCSTIVEFNNRFFEWAARRRYAHNPLLQSIYLGTAPDGGPRPEGEAELRQRVMRTARGHVGLCFEAPAEGEGKAEPLHRRVAQIIADLTANKGFAYSDILILARTNAQLAAMGDYLKSHTDVPQTSSESFHLRSSHAVMALVAALRLLRNPADRTAAADLMQRLHTLGLTGSTHHEAFAGTQPMPDVQRLLAAEGIGFRPAYLAALDLYDCCEEAIHQLRLDQCDTLYLASFLNRVAAFAARHKQDLGELLDHFDNHPRLSASNAEADAVRLMSVHKAKGLDAPVVICLFFNDAAKPLRMWADVPAEALDAPEAPALPKAYIELGTDTDSLFAPQVRHEAAMREIDDLNILYVALTRPREQLYIVCEPPAAPKKGEADLRYPALLADFQAEAEGVDYGEPLPNPRQGASPAAAGATERIGSIHYADWPRRVSFAAASDKAARTLMDERVRFGLNAHDLMASILHADDVEEALARLAARQDIGPDERARLAALARETVTHPLTARFFAPGARVRTECWVMHNGKPCRPDRVVETGEATWVIDFKTGAPMPDHEAQVRTYCQCLARMGFSQPRGCLIYLQPALHVVEL